MFWLLVRGYGKLDFLAEVLFRPALPALSLEERKRREALARGHTLFHFQASPNARRVRFALRELGLSVPLRDILEEDAAQEDLVRLGGIDQVPCLRIEAEGGAVRWMYESREIVEYLRGRVGA